MTIFFMVVLGDKGFGFKTFVFHNNTQIAISCCVGPLDMHCKFKHNQVRCWHLCEFILNLVQGWGSTTANCLYQNEIYTCLAMISTRRPLPSPGERTTTLLFGARVYT